MRIDIPESLYAHPLKLWIRIGGWLLRHRLGYFAILPLCAGAGFLFAGVPGAGWAAAAAFVCAWASLTTHEFGHVVQLILESRGFATAGIEISPGGWRAVREHWRWLWYRSLNALAVRGLPVRMREAPPLPEAGYLRVVSDMVLSTPSQVRIALAGPLYPVLLWAVAAVAWVVLIAAGQRHGMIVAAAVLAAVLADLVVHPFVSGLVYHGQAFSDLGYASGFLARDLTDRRGQPLAILGRLLARLMSQMPPLVGDLARYLAAPGRALAARDLEQFGHTRPKRMCFSWIYQRTPSGEFTDRVVILAPLGMALMKRLVGMPRGGEKADLARLLADPQRLKQMVSYRRVYSLELNELASRAWELADGSLELHEIAARLSQERGQPSAEILPALVQFFRDLHRKYLLNVNWPDAPVREYPRLFDVLFEYGDAANLARHLLGKA